MGPLHRHRVPILTITVVVPLAWLGYLLLSPHTNADYAAGRIPVLVSWVNVAIVPLLGFLALAVHLATGNPQAASLAWAALAFAAVFPLHRLFTADYNPTSSFLFYGTLARLAFALCLLLLSRDGPPLSISARRRNLALTLGVTGGMAIVRFALKGPLDSLADALGEPDKTGIVDTARKAIELLTLGLAVAAAVRILKHQYRDLLTGVAIPVALLLLAEQSLLFVFSNAHDLYWWSANVLWGLGNGSLLWALFDAVAAGQTGQADASRSGVSLEPGSVIAGFEILKPLGEGGMGRVFQARQLRLDRLVALKVIRAEHGADPNAVRRFEREAIATARLAHPNIVELYDAVDIGDLHVLVMEYVDGTDLSALLENHGPPSVALACDYARQAAQGLQHAHERGLVHRDIKPANLLVSADGKTVKILDMGVARFEIAAEHGSAAAQLTQTGSVMGTPAYLAPEQARDPRNVDIRADVYSLGCTVYHLLTGNVPFEGATLAEVVLRHQLEEPVPIESVRPEVPAAVREIVARMMAKAPQDRYQTPAAAITALAPFGSVIPDDFNQWRAHLRPDTKKTSVLREALTVRDSFSSGGFSAWDPADNSITWYVAVLIVGIVTMTVLIYGAIRYTLQ